MNFSKTTAYSLRILSYMSMNATGIFTANDIFENLHIPFRYLRKQMNMLAKQGFIQSIQGKQGGYIFAKPLQEITLMQIVESNEDIKNENMCFFGFHECPLSNRCAMHDRWKEVKEKTYNILKTTTLLDIKNNSQSLNLSIKSN